MLRAFIAGALVGLLELPVFILTLTFLAFRLSLGVSEYLLDYLEKP